MSFNKVDEALRSVGITLQTTDHQFRDFTDVIMELAEKWSTLDSAQQRYIATQFAGNRQQSRFLALVSNADLLKENLANALNSEDIGTLQALKSLDSLETKINQVQVAYQQFYTTVGIEDVWKALLDSTKNVIDTLNSLPKVFGKIPAGAIAAIANLVALIKTFLFSGLRLISTEWEKINQNTIQTSKDGGTKTGQTWVNSVKDAIHAGAPEIQKAMQSAMGQQVDAQPKNGINFNNITGTNEQQADEFLNRLVQMEKQGTKFSDEQLDKLLTIGDKVLHNEIDIKEAGKQADAVISNVSQTAVEAQSRASKMFSVLSDGNSKWSQGLKMVGQVLTTVGMLINKDTRDAEAWAGSLTIAGGGLQAISAGARLAAGDVSALPQLLTGILNIVNGIGLIVDTDEKKLARLTKEAEELSNIAKQEKANYNTLQRSVDKLEELEKKRYDSAESAEEYQSAVDELADSFPTMIAGFDAAGNIILDTTDAERLLTEARKKSKDATYEAAESEYNLAKEQVKQSEKQLRDLEDILRPQEYSIDRSNDIFNQRALFATSQAMSTNFSVDSYSIEQFVAELYNNRDLVVDESLKTFLYSLSTGTVSEFTEALTLAQNKTETLTQLSELLQGEEQSQLEQLNSFITIIKQNGLETEQGQQAFEQLKLLINDFDFERYDVDFESFMDWFSEAGKTLGSYYDLAGTFRARGNQVISAWQDGYYNLEQGYEYLTKSSSLMAMTTKEISAAIGDKDVIEELKNNGAEYRKYQETAARFWDSLLPSEQELFNTMAADTSNFTAQDFKQIFGNKIDDIFEYIELWYSDGITSIQSRLQTNAAENLVDQNKFTSEYSRIINDVQTRFTKTNEQYLNSIVEQYVKLNKLGYTEHAQELGVAALKLFDQINALPVNLSNALINLINEYGFSSLEDISKIKTYINSNEGYESIDITLLDIISNSIIPNVQLGIQAATSSLLENWNDTSKELSKALSSGLELNEADALIQKARTLGLDLDINKDFILAGDKLILTSNAFNEYLKHLNESSDQAYADYRNRIVQAESILSIANSQDLLNAPMKITEEQKDLLQSLGFSVETYVTENGVLVGDWVTALTETLNTANAGMGNLTAYLDLAKTSLLQTTQWSKGNYESVGGNAAIVANASHQAQLLIDRETGANLLSAVEYFNKAYSSLLQDAISKGFENINPKDYQGILENGIDWRGSYVDLVQRYADYAGLTLTETNDLIAQAMEKDSETTVGAAQDALKDVTFIFDDLAYASKDTILKIANLFGKSFTKLFDEDSYDAALGGYKLKLEEVPELQAITNAQNMVADSIASYFERIATLISQGLSGKLDNSGRDELVSLLDKYNIDLDLKFTQTAEGLKLSADSAASLYSELSKVDSIRAGLVFDELVKQFTAAGEKCETISGTLAEIKRLENELAKEENKSNQELIDRLDLYKRIAAQQLQDPNQFKFMDRNLPNGMQSPENYWNAAGKAYTAINEASTTGYMSVQDYYNIIMEMANLVEMSNGELTWMGMEAGKASERAAELIQMGMSALTNVDGKGVQVALSQLGGDFVNGAAAMKGGLDKGIKVMAQEQIKMLDAQIMMLEAVVAMEELGDIDVDGNGIFGKEDIFTGNLGWDEETQQNLDEYTEAIQNYAAKVNKAAENNENLKTGLEKIKVDNISLAELFTDIETGLKHINLSNDTIVALLQALAEGGESLDWAEGDFESLVQQYANFFPEGTVIDITPEGEPPFKLVCSSSGVARLEVEEDGVSYNGKHYDSESDAVKAAVDDMNQKAAEEAGGEKTVETQQTVTIDLKTVVNTASNTIGKIGSAISDLFNKNNNTVEQKTIQVNLEYGSTFPAGLKDLIEAAQTGLERAINIITPISELPTEIEVTGRIVQYAEQAGINFNEKELSWLNKLTGYISYYTDADNVSTSGLIEKDYLWGTITRYTEADDKVALISLLWKLNTLTGNISKYTDDKADIDNLNQLLNLVGQLVGIDPGDNFDPDTLVDDLHGKVTIAEKDVTLPDISLKPSLDSSLLDQGFEEWKKNNPDFFNPIIDPIVRNNIENTPPNTSPSYNPQTTFNFGNTINSALTGIANWLNKANENASNNGTNLYSLEEFSKIMEEHAASTEESTDTTDNNRKAQENNTKKTNEASRATGSMATQLKGAAKNALQAGVDFLTSTKPLDKIGTNVTSVTNAESGLAKSLNRLGNAVESAVTAINAAIKRISTGSAGAKGTTKHLPSNGADYVYAKGNFADARGTLMGELGEELYVTNGHYYIAGAAGPEFVDLPDDAIVFNHLQTKRLLQNGKVSTHGKPVTNEKKATSFVTGNAEGPAMASARSVLEELKNIRAMWQALLEADPKKLGSLAGSGKGGSGGGGGSNKDWDMKSYTAEIQRWYNLLRQIAVLEKEITHQETLRSKLASDLVSNGRAIYESQKKSLAALDKEIINQKSLLILQKEYYADQQKELENSEYNKIFEFKDGTLQYRGSGETSSGLGLDILEQLQRRDVYGKAIDNAETAQKQLDYLVAQGFDIDKLRYNDDGTEVKLTDDKGKALEGEELQNAQVQMLENFFSNISSFMNEFDSAADNIADLENNILENESSKNEILRDIRDNQIELEEKIRDAIVEREQQRIDKAKEERDALKESADEFLEGLNNSLNKERQMYQANQSAEDLNKLRRRLAILQRSGGSSSQIRSLQQEIDSKTQDAYFDAQQKQIDAVKEASDLEIERLDRQIEVMEETLDYQKANGLLWAEVNSILGQDSAVILEFVSKYSGEGGLSILANTEQLNDLKSSIGQYQAYLTDENKPNINPTETDLRDDAFRTTDAAAEQIGMELGDAARDAFNEAYSQTGDTTVAQQVAVDTHKNIEVPKETSVIPKPEAPQTSIAPEESKKTEEKSTTTASMTQDTSNNQKTGSNILKKGSRGDEVRALQVLLYKLGYTVVGKADGIFGANTESAVKQFQSDRDLDKDGKVGPLTREQLRRYGYGYSEGGLVDYTGLAVVHGSPTQPESFLDAEDTKFLKANLEAQKVILPDLMDAYRMVNNYNTTNRSATASTSNAMQIDNIDINLQIASMNSRYDAKQAANDIADELMSIARKSGNISINRR